VKAEHNNRQRKVSLPVRASRRDATRLPLGYTMKSMLQPPRSVHGAFSPPELRGSLKRECGLFGAERYQSQEILFNV